MGIPLFGAVAAGLSSAIGATPPRLIPLIVIESVIGRFSLRLEAKWEKGNTNPKRKREMGLFYRTNQIPRLRFGFVCAPKPKKSGVEGCVLDSRMSTSHDASRFRAAFDPESLGFRGTASGRLHRFDTDSCSCFDVRHFYQVSWIRQTPFLGAVATSISVYGGFSPGKASWVVVLAQHVAVGGC